MSAKANQAQSTLSTRPGLTTSKPHPEGVVKATTNRGRRPDRRVHAGRRRRLHVPVRSAGHRDDRGPREAAAIRDALPSAATNGLSSTIDLGGRSGLPRSYEAGNLLALTYEIDGLPDEGALCDDLSRMITLYQDALAVREDLRRTTRDTIVSVQSEARPADEDYHDPHLASRAGRPARPQRSSFAAKRCVRPDPCADVEAAPSRRRQPSSRAQALPLGRTRRSTWARRTSGSGPAGVPALV